jgi:hypothetical protein
MAAFFLGWIRGGAKDLKSGMLPGFHQVNMSAESGLYRNFERDAMNADTSEKIFDDDDMWKVFEEDKQITDFT